MNTKKDRGLIVACGIFFILVPLPWLNIIVSGKPWDMKVEDVAVINGIITASAVIYAFTLTGVARYRGRVGLLLDIILASSTIFMVLTGGFYYFDYVKNGYATLKVLTWAATSLFWNCATWFSVVTSKAFGEEI